MTGAHGSEPPATSLGRAADSSSRLTRKDRWKVGLGLLLFGWLVQLLTKTWRRVVVEGREHLEALLRDGGPVVMAGWHQGLLVSGRFVYDELIRKGFRFTVLVSLSRDGEILARVARRFGVPAVRGSASRGGLHGLRLLYRTISRQRSSVGLAPDGPRGPALECKPGVVLLAQIAGVPIVPVACATDRAWRLRSWDRMLVPKPFARVAFTVGAPIAVPAELSSEELAAEAGRVGEVLEDLRRRAEAAVRGRLW